MSEPASTLYDRLGGAEGIKRLVSAYLEALTTNPDYAALCALYVNGLERYEERMNEFLSGWLGGPALYQERHACRCCGSRIVPSPLRATWPNPGSCACVRRFAPRSKTKS